MAPHSSSNASPPGPALQSINAALHREPLASIFHAYFWCLFLLCWTPVAIVALQVRAAIRLLFWFLAAAGGHRGRAAWCDPNRSQQEYEMAVVITGCDCGFGKELALWAADAGYIVFAGCREKNSSLEGLVPDRLITLQMDVTSDEQVAGAVKAVEAWLKGSGTQYEKKKRRVLHALINNAGVGTGGLVDWARLSDFQFCIDGMDATSGFAFVRRAHIGFVPVGYRVHHSCCLFCALFQSTIWAWFAVAKLFCRL